MKVVFDHECVMHVVPEDHGEAMALNYWFAEYTKHGAKMLDIELSPRSDHDHKMVYGEMKHEGKK